MPTTTQARVVTPPELACMWRCRIARIYELIRSGELRAFTIGKGSKQYKISLDEVSAFQRRNLIVADEL